MFYPWNPVYDIYETFSVEYTVLHTWMENMTINQDPLGGVGRSEIFFFKFYIKFSVKKEIIHSHRDLNSVSSSTDKKQTF